MRDRELARAMLIGAALVVYVLGEVRQDARIDNLERAADICQTDTECDQREYERRLRVCGPPNTLQWSECMEYESAPDRPNYNQPREIVL